MNPKMTCHERPSHRQRTRSRSNRTGKKLARVVRACRSIEHLETRVLLSGYTLDSIALVSQITGSAPSGSIVLDRSGNLYGTAGYGGGLQHGTVFQVPHGSSAVQTLASLNGSNGDQPWSGLTSDPDGNLYGTAAYGGAFGVGTVFEIPAGTGSVQVLASFGGTTGAAPLAAVTLDAAGNIYGTTSRGGTSDKGTIFKLARRTTAIQTLVSFNGVNGENPQALLLDSGGNLFGTTSEGGTSDKGTVFEYSAATGTLQTLASFNGANGANPTGRMTADASGNLYGTTFSGGPNNAGTVFKIPRGSLQIQTLASFNGANGANPEAGVALDAAGNFYGAARNGGPFGRGTVFEITAGTGTTQTLVAFNGVNGANPQSGVALDSRGHLYGTTFTGGQINAGTVFELTPVPYTTIPFLGHPFDISTDTIEAENFDNGGEGISYHDTTPGNHDGQYRPMENVDINKQGSNGYSVGYTAPGEWLSYSIVAPVDGAYLLQAAVANYKQGGVFHIDIDGKNVTGAMTVPDTGPWDTWQTITSRAFYVSAGNHTMRVVMDSGGYWGNVGDFDYFRFLTAATPFHGQPINISTDYIEAEDFDKGADGIAYHDTTPQNITRLYRDTAVDIVPATPSASNGFAVGYTAPGEWLTYTISAPTQASYCLQARVANYKQGGAFHVEIDGTNVTGTMTVPDTGPWDTWQVITSRAFVISAGIHQMRVVMDRPGFWGNIGDFDYFRFMPAGPVRGTPFNISTETIPAVDFDFGGPGVAYYDTTPNNHNGLYRPEEQVDINKGGSNGFSVGYTAPGEWLNYTINAPAQGTYRLLARVANYKPGGTFHIEIDGQNVTGTLTVPDTGPWDTWQTLTSQAFSVSAGKHVMRVVMDRGGFWGNIGDFDFFRFVPAGVVTLVSQERSVTVYSVTQTSTVVQTTQADAGDFGPYNPYLAATDYYVPDGTARASQSSTLTVTPTGAQFSAAGAAYKQNRSSGTGAQTAFKVVFDIYSPVAYTLTFDQGHDPQHPRATASLAGPGGALSIDPIENQSPGYVSTGTLQLGRYTLSTSAFGGQQFKLNMNVGSG